MADNGGAVRFRAGVLLPCSIVIGSVEKPHDDAMGENSL
jgi:hypothetical protein